MISIEGLALHKKKSYSGWWAGSVRLISAIVLKQCLTERVFGSVVAVAFQIIFYVEMHVNDFFYFLKIIFDISTSKWSETYKQY
jgi:hypothetical protein